MQSCTMNTYNDAEAQEISKQIAVEVALLIHIEEALRIALDWGTGRRGNIRKLSTLRFVARSFERHLARVRALSEFGGYMHLIAARMPQLGEKIEMLRRTRDELHVHLEKMLLEMEHCATDDAAAFEAICGELENYLGELASHAQQEADLLQQCFADAEGGSG